MSLKDLKDGCDIVDQCFGLNGPIMALGIASLQPYVIQKIAAGKTYGDPTHKTTYGYANHEMHAWYTSLLMCQYVADLLGRKVRDKHCQMKREDPTHVCTAMPAEHLKMLQDYRAALEGVLADVKLLEASLVPPAPPGPGPAGSGAS